MQKRNDWFVSSSVRRESEMRYTIIIQWSDEDDAYVVTLPEWEETGEYFVRTHGETYDEALRNGEDLLAELIAQAQADGNPLPQPKVFGVATV